MSTFINHHQKATTPSPVTGIAGAIYNGVMSGLGTVVGAVQGTLGIGHASETTEKPVPSSGPIQAVQRAPKTAAPKSSPPPKQSKSRSVKAKALKAPKQKVSRDRQAAVNALSKAKTLRKSKALRHQ